MSPLCSTQRRLRDRHVTRRCRRAAKRCKTNDADSDIVIRTSGTLVTGGDAVNSLVIARTVSAALVGTVPRRSSARVRPAFVLAKGRHHLVRHRDRGPGNSAGLVPGHDAARHHLACGSLVTGPAQGIPYIVFAEQRGR